MTESGCAERQRVSGRPSHASTLRQPPQLPSITRGSGSGACARGPIRPGCLGGSAPNEPNFPRFWPENARAGSAQGARLLRRFASRNDGRSPGPGCVKQSQFAGWAAWSGEAGNVKQSQFRPGGGRRGRSRPGNPKLETRKTSGGARMGTGAPNEPNLGVFGPEMGAAMKNKANLPGCWAEQAGRAGAPPASCPAGPVLVGSGFAVANQRAMKADWKG